MNTEQKFYIYEHVRPDTGAVFYTGKGHSERAKNFNARSKKWKQVRQEAGGVEVRYAAVKMDEELSFLAEMEYIDVLRRRGVALINESNGGTGNTGWIPSEETKRKIGEANKNKPHLSGEQHPMYGKKHTPESLAKMKESQSKREWGEKHPFYGKTHSEETKAKISENRKGKMVGVENPFYGKTHTPEVIEKMRAAHLGRKQSPEEKAKRIESIMKSEGFQKRKKPVLCLNNGVVYESRSEAARQLGLWSESIKSVCQGKLRKTGGYKFEWSNK